ncbi:MAG: hypothetical protein AAGC96_07135 [Pseudomonadota bacterium]
MNALPFFFLSLLIRAFLVGLGVFGAYVFWVLLADLIWMDPRFVEAAKLLSMIEPSAFSFTTMRALFIVGYSLGILLCVGIAVFGLWLIYRRIRGGVDAARYVAPESLASRIVAGALFGLFGVFFTLMSIGHLRTAVNVINTANFASQTEAVVVEKKPTLKNGKSVGPFVDVRIALPDGGERLEEVLVPYSTYRRVEEGGTLAVLYWPQKAGGVVAEDDYSMFRVVRFSIKTMIVIALALVGLSSFYVCINGNEPAKPKSPKPAKTATRLAGRTGQAGGFGKRV